MFKNVLKKAATLFVGATMCMTAFVSLSSNSSLTAKAVSANETAIYNFLTTNMKLNNAAASGILANIEKESSFRNDVIEYGYTWNSGGGYGICQWTNSPRTSSTGRRTNLVNFCKKNGYNYKSLNGQLNFLKHELETNVKPGVLSYMRSVSNNAQGAYNAGYKWCYSFEVPANYKTVAVTRGNLARDTYWPRYKNNANGNNNNNNNNKKYFPKCSSSYKSIIDALKSVGADSSSAYRKKIAAKNGISNYSGTYDQNVKMLNLLKAGKLIKP